MKPINDRLMDLEICMANQEKTLDELNAEVLRQSKLIDALVREVKRLRETQESNVRPLSEETPPPHY